MPHPKYLMNEYNNRVARPIIKDRLIIYFTRGKDGRERVCDVQPEEKRLKLYEPTNQDSN